MAGQRVLQIRPERVRLLLVDIQDYFVDRMVGDSSVFLTKCEQLFLLSSLLDIPTLATFEDGEKRLDSARFPNRLESVFPEQGSRWIKRCFDLCREEEFDPEILESINAGEPKNDAVQIVVAGGEIDVCVLQTVLGLLERDYQVFVLDDCVYSSAANTTPAFRRMYSAGAIPTTHKIFYHEMTRRVGHGPRLAATFNASHLELPDLVDPEELPN